MTRSRLIEQHRLLRCGQLPRIYLSFHVFLQPFRFLLPQAALAFSRALNAIAAPEHCRSTPTAPWRRTSGKPG